MPTSIRNSPLWVNLSLVAIWFAIDSNTPRASGRLGIAGIRLWHGLMTKGFLALMLPVLIALPYMIWQRRFGELVRYGLVAVAVAALVSVPWALAVHYREPDFWRFFFWHEHIRRFAAGEDAQHARPWWFYLPLLFASLAMGPAVAFDAAAHLARKRDPKIASSPCGSCCRWHFSARAAANCRPTSCRACCRWPC
jgi:4-amino-4-deoxy-L-arabinose transferase